MALDTRDKRDSAIGLGLPWRMRFPVPDGDLSPIGDRQHLALLYRGIETAVPPAGDPKFPGRCTFTRRGFAGELRRRGLAASFSRRGLACTFERRI